MAEDTNPWHKSAQYKSTQRNKNPPGKEVNPPHQAVHIQAQSSQILQWPNPTGYAGPYYLPTIYRPSARTI